MIPNDLVLQTSKVLLRPVNENDLRAFMVLCQDKHMWEYFSTNLADAHQLEDWMKKPWMKEAVIQEFLLPSLINLQAG